MKDDAKGSNDTAASNKQQSKAKNKKSVRSRDKLNWQRGEKTIVLTTKGAEGIESNQFAFRIQMQETAVSLSLNHCRIIKPSFARSATNNTNKGKGGGYDGNTLSNRTCVFNEIALKVILLIVIYSRNVVYQCKKEQ